MTPPDPDHAPKLTDRLNSADRTDRELMAYVHAEMQRLARSAMRHGDRGLTLSTGAVVNEAFLKLFGQGQQRFRDRGHFLAIAATAMRQVLVDHARSRLAEKRGGGHSAVPWETLTPEDERQFATPADPAADFDRQWALALLRNAFARLEAEHRTADERRQFELLRPYLTRRPDPGDYDRLAASLGVARGSVPVLVHRLGKRYQELIRAEVAATVSLRTDIDAELRHCLQALG